MKRKLTAITLFVVVIAIITAFQMSFNSRTPILRSGDVLTDEVLSRHLIVMPDEAHRTNLSCAPMPTCTSRSR